MRARCKIYNDNIGTFKYKSQKKNLKLNFCRNMINNAISKQLTVM